MTMARFMTSAALVAFGLSTAGCGPVAENGLTYANNPSLTSVNQPVVQRTDYALDLASGGSGIPASELERLDHWFQSLQLGYGDRVSLDAGSYDPRSREDVARVAASYGVLLADGAPLTGGSPQPGSVRVIVSRSTASVPGCPIWEDRQIGQSTHTSTNYGCAINSNLANMIADPNDLVLGQSGALEAGGATGAKAVKSYRDKALSGASGTVKAEGGK